MEIVRVGILHDWKGYNPIKSAEYAGCFKNAKKYGIDLFNFTINDVNIADKTINARYRDQNGKKVEKIVSYPDIVCNSFTSLHGAYKDLEAHVKFTRNYAILDKIEKYKEDELLKSEFNDLVIEHKVIREYSDVEAALKKYSNIIIKPSRGLHRIGVVCIKCLGNDRFFVKGPKMEEELSVDGLRKFCADMFEYIKKFPAYYYLLAQPFRESVTKDNRPFDVRIYAKRGRDGNFVTCKYVRTGLRNSLVSNLNRGIGKPELDVTGFLKSNFDEDIDVLAEQLEYIQANFFEFYQSLYERELFNIGLDLGVTRTDGGLKLALFEVNIRLLGATAIPEINAEATLGYYRYLYEQKKKESRR